MSELPTMILVGGGGFTMLLLAGGGMLLSDARDRKVTQRTDSVLAAYRQAPVVTPSRARATRLANRVTPKKFMDQFAQVFGIEMDRPELYPVPWWTVLPAMVVVGVIVAQAVIFFAGPLGWLALPVAWFMAVRWIFNFWLDAYRTTLRKQMPDMLAMIVRAVRAGIPVGEAFRMVAIESPPLTAREFTIMYGEISVGVLLDDALWKLAMRTGLREYRFLAVALSLQAQTGGNLTEMLENLSDTMRKRQALRQRGHALSSEGRTTAVVLTLLPILTGVGLDMSSPDYIGLLFYDPMGKKLFLGVILFLGLGLWSVQTIIKQSLK
jgi:tight adherence protein B